MADRALRLREAPVAPREEDAPKEGARRDDCPLTARPQELPRPLRELLEKSDFDEH
jgi:hypothetical protein